MNDNSKPVERVIGLDAHPDSFTAALIRGPTPAAAIVEKVFNKVPLRQLQSWAKQHIATQDLIVLEASGNSFQVVRTLAAIERKALILESNHIGKLKETDKNSLFAPPLLLSAARVNLLPRPAQFLDLDRQCRFDSPGKSQQPCHAGKNQYTILVHRSVG